MRRDPKYSEITVEQSTHQRIVAGARRNFLHLGFRGVTMDDLAQELGMSKKTLYAHFPSKLALVKAVILDKFHDIQHDLERITSQWSSDVLGGAREILACMQHHIEEINPAFLRDIRRGSPQLLELVMRRRQEMIHHYIGRLLRKGRDAGLIRGDIPVELVIEMLIGAREVIMNPEKLTELGLTPKTCFSAIVTIILEGVVTDAGRAKL
jgi:AcrR family transcriptional regulator